MSWLQIVTLVLGGVCLIPASYILLLVLLSPSKTPAPATPPATPVATPPAPAPAPVRASSRRWGKWLIWLLVLIGFVAGGWAWWTYGPPVPVWATNLIEDTGDRWNGRRVEYLKLSSKKTELRLLAGYLLETRVDGNGEYFQDLIKYDNATDRRIVKKIEGFGPFSAVADPEIPPPTIDPMVPWDQVKLFTKQGKVVVRLEYTPYSKEVRKGVKTR